jgi:NAD(P)-dependent dehydrogenase (short-subunit alcohol dehydrogenase family)
MTAQSPRECGSSQSQASRLVAIRMASALIEHLKTKDDAVVAYTSSVLGFVPLAVTAVYSSTKAALQRFMLRDSRVRVLAEHDFVDAFNAHMLSLFNEHQAVAGNRD